MLSNVDSDTFVAELKETFLALADTDKAASMRAYMKDRFDFFGINAPDRRETQRILFARFEPFAKPFELAERLFEERQREIHYVACDLLRRHVQRKRPAPYDSRTALTITERLIRTGAWWDTVDVLSPHVAYHVVQRTPDVDLRSVARRWIEDDDIWIQRSAIIMQLKAKTATDVDLLFELVLRRAASKEFFVRKGAGWALRELSKTEPTKVRSFLDEHSARLSPLTLREGGKYC